MNQHQIIDGIDCDLPDEIYAEFESDAAREEFVKKCMLRHKIAMRRKCGCGDLYIIHDPKNKLKISFDSVAADLTHFDVVNYFRD